MGGVQGHAPAYGGAAMTGADLSALVNVYSVLSNALSVIRNAHDQALINNEIDPEDASASSQVRILEEEETQLENRLKEILKQIRAAPVRSTQDLIEKMRFELLAYGESPIPEDFVEEIREAFESRVSSRRRRTMH